MPGVSQWHQRHAPIGSVVVVVMVVMPSTAAIVDWGGVEHKTTALGPLPRRRRHASKHTHEARSSAETRCIGRAT